MKIPGVGLEVSSPGLHGKGNVRGDLDGTCLASRHCLRRHGALRRCVLSPKWRWLLPVGWIGRWPVYADKGVLGMNGFHQRDIFNAEGHFAYMG